MGNIFVIKKKMLSKQKNTKFNMRVIELSKYYNDKSPQLLVSNK